MKTAILVNGVPASGKSTVARGVADLLGYPLMTLDSIKDPLFETFGTGDRDHNRRLGRASYAIIFKTIADWPVASAVVIDAWFGFQPPAVLDAHLRVASIDTVREIWCHAPGAVLADRYRNRLADRSPGHPGADYIPELMALAKRAGPTGRGSLVMVDTTQPIDFSALVAFARHGRA